MFNIYIDPPTPVQISSMREIVNAGNKIEDSVAFKVFVYCPIPVVDVVAGLIASAVEHAVKDDPVAQFKPDHQGLKTDWSATSATQRYTEKVMALGRQLVAGEVEALQYHLKLESGGRYALGVVGDQVKTAASGLFDDLVASARDKLK